MIVTFGTHVCNYDIPSNFFFLKVLIFGVFRGVKGQTITQNYLFHYVLLYISGILDHIIEILIMMSTDVFLYFF